MNSISLFHSRYPEAFPPDAAREAPSQAARGGFPRGALEADGEWRPRTRPPAVASVVGPQMPAWGRPRKRRQTKPASQAGGARPWAGTRAGVTKTALRSHLPPGPAPGLLVPALPRRRAGDSPWLRAAEPPERAPVRRRDLVAGDGARPGRTAWTPRGPGRGTTAPAPPGPRFEASPVAQKRLGIGATAVRLRKEFLKLPGKLSPGAWKITEPTEVSPICLRRLSFFLPQPPPTAQP